MKPLLVAVLLIVGAGIGAGTVLLNPELIGGHETAAAASNERQVLHYRHPHNPSITSETPRKDEMGMDYVPIYAGDDAGGGPAGSIGVSPIVQQNMNVRIAAAERGELARQVNTVGFVEYDEAGLHHVHLRTEGWIETLKVRTTGERVEAGQLLFELYSPVLVNAQEELLAAVRRGGGIEPARERLRALGMSAREIAAVERAGKASQLVPVRARHGGVVTALNVAEGMFVTPGTEVMTVADLGRVWVLADLFEHQVDAVAAGRQAQVKLPFRPGEALTGKVDYVYPALASQTRTVRARLSFDNPDERLKPGMYADVSLDIAPLSDVVHVPATAVIRTGRLDRVILALGEGRFQAREVLVGRRAGERLEIIDGLREGERIVTSGQFLLDSEASVSGELSRMSDAHEDGSGEVWADGRINSVDAANRKLNLYHEPIPEISWPAMTMDFDVAEDVELTGIEPGMAVRFAMVEAEEFVYVITAIMPAGHDHH